jgi:hypothetical protein
MRYRKRVIFLIVIGFSARDVQDLLPGPETAMASLPPLTWDYARDVMEFGSPAAAGESDGAHRPFGSTHGISPVGRRALPQSQKEPLSLTAGLTSRRPRPERQLPTSFQPHWTTGGAIARSLPGGNGGVQRYLPDDRGPSLPAPEANRLDFPPLDSAPLAPPPIQGATGFGRQEFDTPPEAFIPINEVVPGPGSIPVPEPAALSLLLYTAVTLLRRRR